MTSRMYKCSNCGDLAEQPFRIACHKCNKLSSSIPVDVHTCEDRLDGVLALLKLMNGVARELHEDYIQLTGEDAFGNEKTELIPDDNECE